MRCWRETDTGPRTCSPEHAQTLLADPRSRCVAREETAHGRITTEFLAQDPGWTLTPRLYATRIQVGFHPWQHVEFYHTRDAAERGHRRWARSLRREASLAPSALT